MQVSAVPSGRSNVILMLSKLPVKLGGVGTMRTVIATESPIVTGLGSTAIIAYVAMFVCASTRTGTSERAHKPTVIIKTKAKRSRLLKNSSLHKNMD